MLFGYLQTKLQNFIAVNAQNIRQELENWAKISISNKQRLKRKNMVVDNVKIYILERLCDRKKTFVLHTNLLNLKRLNTIMRGAQKYSQLHQNLLLKIWNSQDTNFHANIKEILKC